VGDDSKVVLTTGASSRIGAATAEQVAAGHRVVFGARKADRVAAVAEKIRAHVVNVATTLAFGVVPASSVYSATKAAVRALPDGIDITETIIHPTIQAG
jgi:NADP-dependent 3-hydroxy acid dehydrogenase YdfG